MPVKNYGVLKCKAVDKRLGTQQNPHYQILTTAKGESFRIAINVKSQLKPSELLYYTIENYQHPITDDLVNLEDGFTSLRGNRELGLDFIRNNLFEREQMIELPMNEAGDDNDLNDKLERFIKRAIAEEDAVLYVFGDRWGPENGKPDKVFGFEPGNGIHDVHMNQGNVGRFTEDDGVYQDGGMLIHFPSEDKWVGVFLAFQSQSWHTDDQTGHTLAVDDPKTIPVDEKEADATVLIVGAMVTGGQENVTLLNVTDRTIQLTGWSLANRKKEKYPLTGKIGAGEFLTIKLENRSDFFRNKGDIITLLDKNGLKVDGESYTKDRVKEGRIIAF